MVRVTAALGVLVVEQPLVLAALNVLVVLVAMLMPVVAVVVHRQVAQQREMLAQMRSRQQAVQVVRQSPMAGQAVQAETLETRELPAVIPAAVVAVMVLAGERATAPTAVMGGFG